MALAPLARSVGVVDRHPDHGDRRVDAGQGPHARDTAPRADDHPAVDLLAKDGVRAANVAGALGTHGGGFDPEAELAKRFRGVEHALVARAAPCLQGKVEVPGLDLDTQDVRLEQA